MKKKKITFENTFNKRYIEILPSISINFRWKPVVSFMWLFWDIIIKF